eukprot:TRINITY_DN42049_c0_g1_i1.p1 TRINITY_DN42049_c0_g1~~TRINITY_DN42049_c0_g1_i1.p1  ORF type:complete len:570 (-),score=110.94 TRINITY_DN42049_c0_g1_i1:173-1801(-)
MADEEEKGDESSATEDEGDDADDDDEEEEDGEKKEDEAKEDDPNFGRPVARLPPVQLIDPLDYEPKGRLLNLDGVKTYAVGQVTQVGTIILGDLFGYNEGRLRQIADYIGANCGTRVMMPRLMDEPAFEDGTDGDGLPEDFDFNRKLEFKSWIMKYTWETFRPKIQNVLSALRTAGIKRVAGIGFGFGAWMLSKLSVNCGEFSLGIYVYPDIEKFEEMNSNDVVHLAKKMCGTSMFILSGECPATYAPKGEVFDIVKGNFPSGTCCQRYDQQKRGWTIRGDFAKPGIRPDAEHVVTHISKFVRKYMWPPPPGSNAATLRLACREGDTDGAERLVAQAVPCTGPDSLDAIGLAPAHYAAREGHAAAIRVLLRADADPNETGGMSAETPLHVASSMGRIKAVKALVKGNAQLDSIDKASLQPIHLAAREGHAGVIKFLVESKAAYTVRDTAGQTPLHLAAWRGHDLCVRLLLGMKMDVNPTDLRVKTPQQRAVDQGFQTVVDTLQLEHERREAERQGYAVERKEGEGAQVDDDDDGAKKRKGKK